jgi:hypothetical protein
VTTRGDVAQVTAIARPGLLERVSEVVDPQLRVGPRAGVDLSALTGGERGRLRNLLARLTALAEAAAEVRPQLSACLCTHLLGLASLLSPDSLDADKCHFDIVCRCAEA